MCQKHTFYDASDGKRCPKCVSSNNKNYDTFIRASDRKKIYNSVRWAKVREQALLRDEMLCKLCGGLAEMVHHKIELKDAFELAYELDNLQSICFACHSKIHWKEIK